MFVFGLRPSTIDSMSEGSLSQVWEMPAIAPTAQNRRRTDGAQPRCRQFSRAGVAPQRGNCLAGHVGLELRNVTAKYAFERSYRFLVIHRISKIPRGPWVGASSRMPEGAFDDVPFIDALHA